MDTVYPTSIFQTPAFELWLHGIKDPVSRIRIARRLERFASGSPGDIQHLDGSLFELREHFGAGWRLYCLRVSQSHWVFVHGGTKRSQKRDIELLRRNIADLAHSAANLIMNIGFEGFDDAQA